MMKQFLVPCDFNGVTTQVPFYIGNPAKENNPVQHQAHWLSSTRGGIVSQEVMESLQKLNDIAIKNNIVVVDLCDYALNSTFSKKESVLEKQHEDVNAKIESNKASEESTTVSAQEESPVTTSE